MALNHVLLLVGAPGAGKSTTMAQATEHLSRLTMPKDQYPARDALLNARGVQAVELGTRRGTFSGTDALPMDVNPRACAYLAAAPEQPAVVLAEGARLANRRFLQAAIDTGAEVTLLHLDNPLAPLWREKRNKSIGKTQNPSWARGRETAARNLANNAPKGVNVQKVSTTKEAEVIIRQLLFGQNAAQTSN